MNSLPEDSIPRRKRWPKIAALLVVVAGLGLAAVYTIQSARAANAEEEKKKEAAEEKAPVPVSTAAVETGTVSSYLAATANLVPENEVKVLAEAEGRVARLLVEEGQSISKGQVIAELLKGDGEINLQKAKVRLGNAEASWERASRLHGEGLMSPQDLDRSTMEKALAKEEVSEAEWRLEKTRIRAPFSGRITQRPLQQGQDVRFGQELVTIASFEPLVARIYLPEKDVLALRPDQQATIVLKADERIQFKGRIQQVAPTVDTATGTVKVTVEALERPESVRPGAFVEVRIVQETRARALMVPREAIVRELQKAYVFVAKDGVATKTAVQLGLEEDGRIELTSGVQVGDQVITAGQGSLKDGAPVKVIETKASTAEPPSTGRAS